MCSYAWRMGVFGAWVSELQRATPKASRLPAFPGSLVGCWSGVSAGWVSGLQRATPTASRLPAFPGSLVGCWSGVSAGCVTRLQRANPKASRLPAFPRVALAVPAGHRSLIRWPPCSRFASLSVRSDGGFTSFNHPTVGHPYLPVRFRGASRLAAHGHRPGARLRVWSNEARREHRERLGK